MATNFIDLQLDKDTGDLLFVDGDLALVQNNMDSLWQRLSLGFSIWLGEWQFNLDYGFPYPSLLGKKTPKEVVDAAIKTAVFKEPDVLRIESFESSFNKSTRSYEAYFTVITTELESVNIAFIGTQYIYPSPQDLTENLCPSFGDVVYGEKLYHLINFRLPVNGDATWINQWDQRYKSISLDFINKRYTRNKSELPLEDIITFSRGSIGTDFVGGVLTEFAVDVPRVGDGGLLVERESTNILLNSESYSPTISGGVVSVSSTMTAGANFVKLTNNGTAAGAVIAVSTTYQISAGDQISYSCFSKLPAQNETSGRFRCRVGYLSGFAFDMSFYNETSLSRESVTPLYQIFKSTPVNDAQLFYMRRVFTAQSSYQNAFFQLQSLAEAGVSNVGLQQIELHGNPTSYIPTTGTPTTRQRDVSTVSVPSDTNTAIVEYEWDGLSYERTIFNLGDDTASHRITVKHRPSGFIELTASEFGVVQATATYPAPSSAGVSKVAVSYSDSKIIFAVNGQSTTLPITTPITSVTTLNIGQSYGATDHLNAHIRKVDTFVKELPSNVLQQLTS